jgi:hypothetical protein
MADSAQPSKTSSDSDDKLWRKLARGMQSAVELRVVTVVGGVELGGDLRKPTLKLAPNAGKNTLATSINLVQGDITSVIPEPYWAPEREVVRQFHEAQVERGQQIVDRNVRLIAEVGKAAAEAIKELAKLEDNK